MKFSPALPLCALVALLSFVSSALVGALLPQRVPKNHDEFAYLLEAQTFADFRLTNPTPPLPRFFETPHVLLQPSCMAKYPPGHGLAIAVGLRLGNPIYGVRLESAFFAGAVTWMLLGLFSARWALLGGIVVILQFGLTHYWAQTYWGGALAAGGGALIFGATLRLWRRPATPAAALLGAGAVILMLTRPFEGLLACVVPGAVLLSRLGRDRFAATTLKRLALPFAGVALAGALFLLFYQFRVTGSPWRAPYLEYETQYSGAPLFIWQKVRPEPSFQNEASRVYYRDYVLARSRHTAALPVVWFRRLRSTTGDFLGIVLTGAALLGLLRRPGRWELLALAGLAVVSSALVLCFWFGLHYQAPAAALYLFLAIAGARTLFLALPRRARNFRAFAAVLLAAQLAVFAHAQARDHRLAQLRATTLRQRILDTLRTAGGRHLVFVRLEKPYDPNVCWVCNDARLADSAVVWAWDRGPAEDRRLLAALPGRHAVTMTLRGEKISFAAFPPPAKSLPP